MPALETTAQRSAGDRFAWLDVARAVAVSAVALMHLFDEVSPEWRAFNYKFFNPGVYGVVLFFLVSGFVIPLSLERRGSLRVFATSRLLRLYPLYWASLIAVTALHLLNLGVPPLDFTTPGQLLHNFLWNATMLQYWAEKPTAIGLYWTLAYELAFYAATAILFAVKLNRRTDIVVVLGAAYMLLRGVVLPAFKGEPYLNPEQFWMVTFFVGTLWYRGWTGEFGIRRIAIVTGIFAAAVVANHVTTFSVFKMDVPPTELQPLAVVSAWAAAYASFLVLLWLRSVSWPRALTWVGKVSYSVYLMHGVLLIVSLQQTPAATFAMRLIVLLPLCAVTYRYIERPMIAIGHRLANRGQRARDKAAGEGASSGRPALLALVASVAIAAGIGVLDEQITRARLNARHTIEFDAQWSPHSALVAGWSLFESGGADAASIAWCESRECILDVTIPDAADRVLKIRLAPFAYIGAPAQALTVQLNDSTLGTAVATPGWTVLSFKARRDAWRPGSNQLRLHFAYAESPKSKVPSSDDERTLSAAFDWIEVKPDA
jgi:peptidoglycan/LPS O-acetylase OafA/YrhL